MGSPPRQHSTSIKHQPPTELAASQKLPPDGGAGAKFEQTTSDVDDAMAGNSSWADSPIAICTIARRSRRGVISRFRVGSTRPEPLPRWTRRAIWIGAGAYLKYREFNVTARTLHSRRCEPKLAVQPPRLCTRVPSTLTYPPLDARSFHFHLSRGKPITSLYQSDEYSAARHCMSTLNISVHDHRRTSSNASE
ncbi:hypothetical protein HYPSUDRAFT_1054767 [Hypholoma sublateritium FD-334 SS-4]|uniref:Uncharacterized protein n=1 Tax=Hypholoma sublateritium (strain FD-334 SS-4) TaxID=945553 RepID=A0A0D2KQD5_HYPSF|nr:hypothetical protein HYPSUDRAFT_1054767 [Hypholoma sublateritium FD-334 SS-4]